MTFEEARKTIVAALHNAGNVLHDTRFSARLQSPEQDIAFDEFDLDSLSAVEVCMEVEEKVGLEVDLGDLVLYPSLNALAKSVAERTKP